MRQIPLISSFRIFLAGFAGITVLFSCKSSLPSEPVSHEIITGKYVPADSQVVVSARAEATRAGVMILRKGGNAFDAAVAVHFALAVCYPQAGNIGGGGFLLARKSDGTYVALDFRETAPAASTENMFRDERDQVIPKLSTLGALASGVPGSVAGILEMHEKYGSLPLDILLQSAIDLAIHGYVLTALDTMELYKVGRELQTRNSYVAFWPSGGVLPGDTIRQPDLARTLQRIAQYGKKEFYEGLTADLLVQCMQRHGGIITREDLQNYRPVWREPLFADAFGYRFVSMPPPSSGGIALLQMLKMAEMVRLDTLPHLGTAYISRVVELEKRAYADRAFYLGDPAFVQVPVQELLSDVYLAQRLVNYTGVPLPSAVLSHGKASFPESEQTTHYCIADRFGNVVNITTTLNSPYGSCLLVNGAGFLLNNEMDDFSAKPGVPNQFGLVGNKANAVAPGKRMLSSMTPTIVEKDGKVSLAVGTPGGATIITSVFQICLDVEVFGLPLYESVQLPRFHHQWLPDKIWVEDGHFHPDTLAILEKMGYTIQPRSPIGRVEAISWTSGGIMEGVADERGDDAAGR